MESLANRHFQSRERRHSIRLHPSVTPQTALVTIGISRCSLRTKRMTWSGSRKRFGSSRRRSALAVWRMPFSASPSKISEPFAAACCGELVAKANASFPREKAQRRCLSSLQTTWRNATRQTQRVRPISERRPSPDAYAGAEFCHTIVRRSVCDAAPAGP